MGENKLMGKIEAVLFACGDPIEVAKLSQILKADKGEIDSALEGLKNKYGKKNSGIKMLELEGSVQLSNKEEYGDYIKEALLVKRNATLSSAAMEVLSIVAYNQPEPVTKSYIEQIRGVDSSATVNSLVEKGLIEEAGRHNLPGRPIVYRTTDVFLRSFGISSVAELPPLPSGEEQLDLGLTENTDTTETAANEVDSTNKAEGIFTRKVDSVGVEEVSAIEVDTAGVELEEVPAIEVDTAEVELEEVSASEVDTAGVEEVSASELDTVGVEEVSASEVDTAGVEEVSASELDTVKVEEISTSEEDTAGVEEVPAIEVDTAGVEEVSASEVDTAGENDIERI